MTDEPTPHPNEQPTRAPSYSEVPPSLQEYVTALTGSAWVAVNAPWELPTVEHPQGRADG
jgi:hypothetical protein